MDRGDHKEDVSVGFVGFGLTSKKLQLFENQGLICKENIHGWVPGLKLKRQKNYLMNVATQAYAKKTVHYRGLTSERSQNN